MEMITKILVGILLALLVLYAVISWIFPYVSSTSESALLQAKQNLAKDLVATCKEWTDDLALASQFPDALDAKAKLPAVGWDYCLRDYFMEGTVDLDNQMRCRAACVKLLRFEDRCSADPEAFGKLDYDYAAHLMTPTGEAAVSATKTAASQYCLYLEMPTIKSEVAAEFP